jgi:hypothetical protein
MNANAALNARTDTTIDIAPIIPAIFEINLRICHHPSIMNAIAAYAVSVLKTMRKILDVLLLEESFRFNGIMAIVTLSSLPLKQIRPNGRTLRHNLPLTRNLNGRRTLERTLYIHILIDNIKTHTSGVKNIATNSATIILAGNENLHSFLARNQFGITPFLIALPMSKSQVMMRIGSTKRMWNNVITGSTFTWTELLTKPANSAVPQVQIIERDH